MVVVTAPSLTEFLRTIRETRSAEAPASELGNPRVIADGLIVDLGCRQVTLRGHPLHVTRREFGLLVALSNEPRGVLTFDDLLAAGWGDVDHRDVGLVHSAVMRLRAKLREASAPVHIVSVWGVGFRLANGLESSADH